MSSASIKEILHDIDTLAAKDRIKLERELARRRERDWAEEAVKARKMARRRGVSQRTIDRAVERRRYGR